MYLIIDNSLSLKFKNIFWWSFWIISSFFSCYHNVNLIYYHEKKTRQTLSTIHPLQVFLVSINLILYMFRKRKKRLMSICSWSRIHEFISKCFSSFALSLHFLATTDHQYLIFSRNFVTGTFHRGIMQISNWYRHYNRQWMIMTMRPSSF